MKSMMIMMNTYFTKDGGKSYLVKVTTKINSWLVFCRSDSYRTTIRVKKLVFGNLLKNQECTHNHEHIFLWHLVFTK